MKELSRTQSMDQQGIEMKGPPIMENKSTDEEVAKAELVSTNPAIKEGLTKKISFFIVCQEMHDVIENFISSKVVIDKLPGFGKFLFAQIQLGIILSIACYGDGWEPSYHRNENHNMTLYWSLHVVLLLVSIMTWTHKPRERVTLLSREQTEEWKGWMQFSFIMYHYYRAWSMYNWIRVFVSSYVWMTGFGNFLYFDKKKDFSFQRVVSMFIRINYFPVMLSLATGVSLDLYYVVPLHTTGFFVTYLTCLLAVRLQERGNMSYMKSRVLAIAFCFLVHIAFFETKAVNFLLLFSKELHFRFQADKYSAVLGIASGLCMNKASEYMAWAYGNTHRKGVQACQCIIGAGLIYLWYTTFGHIDDKLLYNPFHPYIFIFPLLGWLMLRNSHRYLCEHHCAFLEFLGRNTLETYVLQFHLFMNHSVQHIPVVIPGSDEHGHIVLRTLNMILCGTIFMYVAIWARKVTVSTQMTVVGFMKHASEHNAPIPQAEEVVQFINLTDDRQRNTAEPEGAKSSA